jgi:hypothetical protein
MRRRFVRRKRYERERPGDVAPHQPDAHEGRDGEAIVELVRVPGRFEADLLTSKLHANGIRAMVTHGDGGGWAPHLAVIDSHRFLVFESDVEAARAVIADAPGPMP